MAKLTGSLQVDGNISADSFTGSVQGTATSASYISIDNIDGDIQATNADLADTASYVSGSNVYGEVYEAERARRIEVGSYISYDSLTDIPFITGDYGNSVKRISADGLLQWHAGTNHLTVPGVDATTLTGSLDWDQLENVPDGIMSSSNGIVPDGTVSSSAQTIANLNSTGIVSGSSQITNITIKEQNASNYYPVLFANTSNPSGDFQGQAAYAQITGGTERIRFNPGTGQLELGNLLGSGSIYAYGMITGDEFTATTAFNGQFLNLQSKVVNPDLPSTGQDSFMTLSATSSKANYQIQFENGSMFDPMWSYKGGGYGNQWTRVLTEQNIASGSATLTQVWVNGLVTGSTAEFTTISGSTISGSFVGDGSGLTGLTVDSIDYDNVSNKPTLLSSSAQINFDTDPINIAIGGTSLGSSYRLLRGNVAVGAKAFECVTNVCDLEQNVAIGLCAGRSIDSDSLNSVFIGTTAGGDTSACQNSNIGIGSGAHSLGGGTGNVSIGSVAGQDTTGDYNIAIGFTAARDNVGGDGNVVLGGNAGRCLKGNGSYHVLLGYNAGSTPFFNESQFSADESGSVFAVGAGTGNEPLIHSRFGAYGGVKDYLQINAPTSASSFEAASLTGSLNWSDLEDIPNGIMSSSDGIVPDGTISSSAQVDYEEIQNIPFSSSNPVSPILHPTIGSTDRGHVAIGEGVLEAGVSASNISYGIVAIGQNAAGGLNAGILGSDNVVIGRKAAWNDGNLIEGCTNLSVVVGAYSNNNSSGVENITIGAQSFTSASGHNNTTIGTWAGNGYGLTGNANTMIGYQAGGSDAAGVGMNGDSCRNTLLGAKTSLRNGCCNVLIGYGAGSYTDFNNKLYIENGGSSPLIEGDFSTNYVKINDVLELNQSNPLPSGGVGQLAVSASNLYFHNGSSWSQIN